MNRIVKLYNYYFLVPIFILLTTNIKYYTQTLQDTLQNKAAYFLLKGKQLEPLFQDSAIYYYQKGVEVFNKNKLDSNNISGLILKVKLFTNIGQIFHSQSKYSFASDYYSRALNEAQLLRNDSLIAECNFNIAEIKLENGSYLSAIVSYNKAKEIFKKISHSDGIFWSDIGLGIVYRELGNTDLSKRHYENAEKLGKINNKNDYIAISYNNSGNLYRQIGKYDVALNYLQKALKSFESYGEEKFISDCLDGIGEVFLEIHNYERALEYFKKSTKIAEILGDKYRLLSRYANLAKTYTELNDNENAVMYFSKTIELGQSVGDKARLSEILLMISDFYRKKGSMNNAITYLNKSMHISKEVGDTVSLAAAYNSLSELYFLKNNYNAAYKNALKAYQISSKKDLLKTLAGSSSKLSKIFEIKGNYKDALFYLKIYERINDLLMNSEKIKILEDTEAKYNIEKIEREKLELENKALLNKERIQQRNTLIYALIVAIFLFSAFTGRYIYKKKKEKEESSQKSIKMKEKINLLNTQLSEKNRELTTKALLISQNNNILQDAVFSIEEYLNNNHNDKKELKRLRNQLQEIYEEKSWDDFIQHFEQVHPKFYIKILEKCNDLSSMEQKVCAFLKMNLNTKDISQITGQSTKAIEVMRSRIRKKLNISHEESLTKTIQNL